VPSHLVNLDALIPREYFEAVPDTVISAGAQSPGLKVTELEPGTFTYPFLRKPEFQRETADWDPGKVADLVYGFLNGDLIPAIILWRSEKGNTFVIDGAHRLSAFIAWVHDDYGDRHISLPYFNHDIPQEQILAAQQTRASIESRAGSYRDLKDVSLHPIGADPEKLRFAQNLGTFALTVQWVVGDASTAEQSFFKINQKATLIDPVELELIKGRRQPHALATRALLRAGTGHKYWSKFSRSTQREIETIASEVHESLFKPSLGEPLRTLDVPVAGRGYSPDSAKLLYTLVKYINGLPEKGQLPDDDDGEKTLAYLRAVQRVAWLINSKKPQSLGLHPVVYFYGATGQFQASAFLAVAAFVIDLEKRGELNKFTSARQRFEEFLIEHRRFTNQIARQKGAGLRGVPSHLKMYRTMLDALAEGAENDELLQKIIADQPELSRAAELSEEERTRGQEFSKGVRNAAYLEKAIDSASRCGVCGARMHFKAMTTDHRTPKEEGGLGTQDNAQLTHPYCNTGYKESVRAGAKTLGTAG
jgi:hypothetical protein